MGKAGWYALGASTTVQLAAAVLCAVWPLVGLVGKDDFWNLLWDHYSFLGSNLDVLVVCVVESALLPALLGVILLDRPIPPFNIIAYCTWAVVTLGQVTPLPIFCHTDCQSVRYHQTLHPNLQGLSRWS